MHTRWIRWTLMLSVVIGIGITLWPRPCYACSCIPQRPVQEALQDAAAVFSGRVVAVNVDGMAGGFKVTVAVSTVWKGPQYQQITLSTNGGSASCGYEFTVGREYLIFAHDDGVEQFATSSCSNTKMLTAAAEDLAALGPGAAPTIALPATGASSTPSTPLMAAFSAVIVGAVAFVGVRRLRRPRPATHG